MRSPSRDCRTQPVPSISAWADGSASTANTASGAASIVVDAVTRSGSIPVRRLAEPELIAARDTGGARSERVGPSRETALPVWGGGGAELAQREEGHPPGQGGRPRPRRL